MQRALALVVLAACGGDSGEPIEGDISIDYGGETVAMDVGAAIPDHDADGNPVTRVLLGTRDISCSTTIQTPLKRGTYVTFPIDRTPGMQMPFVSVIRVEAGGAHLNGTTGTVTIDVIDDQVHGSVMSTTTDADVGDIVTTGTFAVIDC